MEKTLLKIIPTLPGVYLFKDAHGSVIYIGKAKSLRPRVNSYFHQRHIDWKADTILHEYADLDYILTKNETEAMILEAELIQKYQPKFNTIFKNGQPFLYIYFSNPKSSLPTIKILRNKKLKRGTYFGPFLQKIQARRVHAYLMRTFKLNTCNKKLEHGCLDFHLGNCAGTCKPEFDPDGYRFRLELAMAVLKNKHKQFIKKLQDKIEQQNQEMKFEQSKQLQHYLENFEHIFETIKTKYNPKRFETDIFVATTPHSFVAEITSTASDQLQQLLDLAAPIRTIDCFDISHFQSSFIVGSCVRFVDGKPDKNKFRRFKIKTLEQQNDYAALHEIVSRRYKKGDDLPDLILIDGGKGQLNAVQHLYPQADFVSLAKREERLYSKKIPEGIKLDVKTDIGKLLIALRDYAHHFAISYHRLRRHKELSSSPQPSFTSYYNNYNCKTD